MLAAIAGLLTAGAVVVAARVSTARVRTPRPPATRRATPPAWVGEACRQAGLEPVATWTGLRVGAAAAALTSGLVVGPAAALVVTMACLAAPHGAAPVLRRRRLAERDAQLPEAFERIAASLRAGSALGPAVAEAAHAQRGPLGDELRLVVSGTRRGASLDDALATWSSSPDRSPEVVLASAALSLGTRAGGRVARAVDGVAATLRERQQLRAEVDALATQARSSAWVLAAAPAAFAALVATVEPETARFLVATPVGLACLVTGLLLDAAGLAWMARIVRSAS